MNKSILLIAVLCALIHSATTIGEGVVDLNTVLGIFGGMANIFSNFNKTDVDIDRIMGRWFQMYKAAINFDVFQTNMYCHVAYFSRNRVMGPAGFTMEEAYHVIGKSGPIETYKRDVTRTGPGEFWIYTDEYFYPRQFYILKVGPGEDDNESIFSGNYTDDSNITASIVRAITQKDIPPPPPSSSKPPYEYLVATDANRLALMVYARDPNKFYETYDKEILRQLQKGGFGGYVFWNQPVAIYQGADCYYPGEKEVFARRALKAGGQKQTDLTPGQKQAELTPAQKQANLIPGGGGASNPLNQQDLLSQSSQLSALLQQQQQQLLQQQAANVQQQRPPVPLQG